MKRLILALCALVLASPALADPISMPVVKKGSTLVNADGSVLVYSPPSAWSTGSTAYDATAYGLAEVQIAGLSGGDSIAFTRSLDGTNYVALTGFYDQSGGGPYSSVTADGVYTLRGGGLLKWTKTGSASTPTVTIRAAQ